MLAAIVLTANHWLLDAVAGIAVALVGLLAAHRRPSSRGARRAHARARPAAAGGRRRLVTVLRVAHRAANDPASLMRRRARTAPTSPRATCTCAADAWSCGTPRASDRCAGSPGTSCRARTSCSRDLAPHLAGSPLLLLDLKAWQPWLGVRVRDEMAAVAPGVAVRRLLPPLAPARRLRRAAARAHRSRPYAAPRALRRLPARLARRPAWGVALHASLVRPAWSRQLRRSVEAVLTWPVPDAAEYARLVAAGAAGVIADDLRGAAGGVTVARVHS